jgi:hypothetical protein
MVVARTIPAVLDVLQINVFACRCCGVDFITEDHLTTSGTAAPEADTWLRIELSV